MTWGCCALPQVGRTGGRRTRPRAPSRALGSTWVFAEQRLRKQALDVDYRSRPESEGSANITTQPWSVGPGLLRPREEGEMRRTRYAAWLLGFWLLTLPTEGFGGA